MADSEVINTGQYIIIQRQDYFKLHKFSSTTSCASLGKDQVELANIENCKYFSTFKMVPKGKGRNRVCSLEKTDTSNTSLKDNLTISESGIDNRNITDDNRSQKLTKDEIIALRDTSLSSTDIVNTLISNSNTFHSKTEFSQDKYLKKKEKKYFEYVQIRKPTIRLIADIMYRQDSGKILGIRSDTLSQILSYSNVTSDGNHLLYDSGTNGLISAALMNSIGANTTGQLVYMHPGNIAQKQALLAMNFEFEQLERCISVNLYSVMRHFYQNDLPDGLQQEVGNKTNKDKSENVDGSEKNERKRKLSTDSSENDINKILKTNDDSQSKNDSDSQSKNDSDTQSKNDSDSQSKNNSESTKDSQSKGDSESKTDIITPESGVLVSVLAEETSENGIKKRPKWELDNERASVLLKSKMDSLVIASKEHPLNIFKFLVPMVRNSRPFVIYHSYQEVLQECYVAMRKMNNITGVKLTHNWMRGYQVLPERTHPDVLMQGNSGFVLTGWIVQ